MSYISCMFHEDLISFLQNRGASAVGFADLHELPSGQRRSMPFGISIAVALDKSIVAGNTDGPTPSWYAEYNRINTLLASISKAGADFIEQHGHNAIGLPPTGMGFDKEKMSAPFQHKTAATRAALGWIGKSALLITPQFGAAIRLTTILTNAPVPAAAPVNESRCPGDCEECLTHCPGKTVSGKTWHQGLTREEFWDAYACYATVKERTLRNVGIEGTVCGICVAVCPFTKRYLRVDA